MKVYFKKGYKYQLTRDLLVQTNIYPKQDINTQYIELDKDGQLLVRCGYASDGPSGLTLDTKTFMRGAFAHDAIYQLIREEHLPPEAKNKADILLREICIEDGMCKIRAEYVYYFVKNFASFAINPKNKKKELVAPQGEIK